MTLAPCLYSGLSKSCKQTSIVCSTVLSLLLLQSVSGLPQPATSFQWQGSGGSPKLYVAEAYHDNNDTGIRKIEFKDISIRRITTIESTALSTASVTNDIPPYELAGGSGAQIYTTEETGTWEGNNPDVWLSTFPLKCSTTSNNISFYAYSFDSSDWVLHNLSVPISTLPPRHYLGRGFVYRSGEELADRNSKALDRLYTFGGLCINSTTFKENTTSEAFSNTLLSVDLNAESNRSFTPSTEVSLGSTLPIPEAGFTWNMIPPNPTFDTSNNSSTALLIGGFTSRSRFIGLGQIAAYTVPTERWAFVNIDQSTLPENTTPRAGHTAVLSEDKSQLILYGGWINNISTPAQPPLLILNIGNYGKGWSWTAPLTSGNSPDFMGLWGHTATLLQGNIMLVTSGFVMISNTSITSENQAINNKIFFYNITSGEWLDRYAYPLDLSATQLPPSKSKDIIILISIFGGLFVIFVVLLMISLFWKRIHRYQNVPLAVADHESNHIVDDHDDDDDDDDDDELPEPTLPPAVHDRRSSTERDRRPHAYEEAHGPSISRWSSTQSEASNTNWRTGKIGKDADMVAWVRTWANADGAAKDAAAKEASFLETYRRMYGKIRPISERTETSEKPHGRVSASSRYSDRTSTLNSSEHYDSPQTIIYPSLPPLLSTAEVYSEQSPRRPSLVAGPEGVVVPLPPKMAKEFPQPTIIPRDSVGRSSYTSNMSYNISTFGSASKPLLRSASTFGAAIDRRQSTRPDSTISPRSTIGKTSVEPLTTRMNALRNSAGEGTFESKVDRTSAAILSPETYRVKDPQPSKKGKERAVQEECSTEIERLRHKRESSRNSLLSHGRGRGKRRSDYPPSGGTIAQARSSYLLLKQRGASLMSLNRSSAQPDSVIAEEPKSPTKETQRSLRSFVYSRVQRAKEAAEAAEAAESTPVVEHGQHDDSLAVPIDDREEAYSPFVYENAEESHYQTIKVKLRVINVTPGDRNGSTATTITTDLDDENADGDVSGEGTDDGRYRNGFGRVVKSENLMNRKGKHGVGLGIAY